MLLFILLFLQFLTNEKSSKTIFIKESSCSSELNIPPSSQVYIAPHVTLTIDNALTLTNCEVVLGANAHIVLTDSAELYILGSHLHGCDTLWDGIYAPPASIVVTDTANGERNRIEDAMMGIVAYSMGGAKMLLRHTDFSRNQVSVALFGYVPVDSLSFDISGNVFGMGSHTEMLPAPAGHANYARPLSGIGTLWSNGISIPNHALSHEPNRFEDMNSGINISQSGRVNVYENYFERIRDYDTLGYNGTGAAVWAGSISYNGWNTAQLLLVQPQSAVPVDTTAPHFLNCDYGVFADRIITNVVRARMDSVKNSVKIMNAGGKIWVSDNYLTNTNWGITLNNNAPAQQRVWNNTIHVNPPLAAYVIFQGTPLALLNTYGIYEAEMSNTVSVNSSIYLNKIYGGRNCIWLNNVKGAQVYSNNLHQTSGAVTGTQAGLYASNCNNLNVTINSATGIGSTYYDALNTGSVNSAYRKSGYSFYMSGGDFCSNAADSIGYASYFASNCNDMKVRKNTYGKSKFGMVLQSSGVSQVLGDQGYDSIIVNRAAKHENEFTGTGANHTFDNDSNFRTYSFINISVDTVYRPPLFYYTGNSVPTNEQYTNPSGATVNGQTNSFINNLFAIQPVLIQSDTITNSPYCEAIPLWLPQPWYRMIAQGQGKQYMEAEYKDVGEWLTQRILFDKLTDNIGLLESDTVLQYFYDSLLNTPRGKMNVYEQKLRELNDSTVAADSALFAQKIHEADSLNKLIAYSNTPEQAFVTVNNIYLAKLKDTTSNFTPAQLSTLQTLAVQCPYVAGDAVYIARALLAQVDDRWYFDDVVLCSEEEGSGKWEGAGNTLEDTIPLRKEFVKVFPNPANDQLNVLFEAKIAGNAKFELLDLAGRAVKTIFIQDGTNYVTFDVRDVSSGMYMWRLKDRARAIGSGKVVIQK